MPLVCALQNGELAAADEQMAGEVVSEAERARWRGILGNLRLSGVQQRSGHIAPKTSGGIIQAVLQLLQSRGRPAAEPGPNREGQDWFD